MHSLSNDVTNHDDHRGSGRDPHDDELLTPVSIAQAEFRALFREMALELHHYAAQRVGTHQAEDLVSDTFLTTWRRWSDLPNIHDHRRAWVYGVLKRNILEHHSLEARRADRSEAAARHLAPPEAEPVDQHVTSQDWVRATLAELPENQSEALRLAILDGFTAREIANQLGTTTAITTRISRGRAALRERLSAREDER